MDIAAMNSRITFQKNETVVDNIGNHVNGWNDYYTCNATISNSGGKSSVEAEAAGVITDADDVNFTVRFCIRAFDVTPNNFRILWRGEQYDIVKVDYLNLKKKALKFKCQKVRR